MTELPEDADGLPLGSLSARQATADAADLRAGIDDLAGLVAGSLGLPELLTEVSTFAVHAIPGADGAGVTLSGSTGWTTWWRRWLPALPLSQRSTRFST